MSVGFQDQVQKLRSILKDAASEGFARVQEVSNLGVVLHKQAELIVDRYSTALEEYEGEVRTWCGALGSFDEAGFPARSLIVARGLRLCQALVGRERLGPHSDTPPAFSRHARCARLPRCEFVGGRAPSPPKR